MTLTTPIGDLTRDELTALHRWLSARIATLPRYLGPLADETAAEATKLAADEQKMAIQRSFIEWQAPMARLMCELLAERDGTDVDDVLAFIAQGGLDRTDYGQLIALREYTMFLMTMEPIKVGQIVETLIEFYKKMALALGAVGISL